MKQLCPRAQVALACLVLFGFTPWAHGCINDSYSSIRPLDGAVRHSLRSAVLGKLPKGPDPAELIKRLAELEAKPQELDPRWWNNLAGAHIRLGHYQKAVDLLTPLVGRFKGDYGIHANLGTALHLLGRYAEAEKHVAEDLRIDPKAHDGLEIYHLALLQYLSAPKAWQAEHLFVDEWTRVFFGDPIDEGLDMTLRGGRFSNLNTGERPEYRHRVTIGKSPEVDQGVTYMLTLNQDIPACFVMAGVIALSQRDGETAKLAFEKAIELGSPQAETIQKWITHIGWINSNARGRVETPTYIKWTAGILGLWLVGFLGRGVYRMIQS